MDFSVNMNTGFATREQLHDYIERYKLRPMMQGLFSELLLHMPQDPVLFLIDSLKAKRKETAQTSARPKRVTVLPNGSLTGGHVMFATDSLQTFLNKAGSLLGITAKRLFSFSGAEYADINLVEGEETLFVSDGPAWIDPAASRDTGSKGTQIERGDFSRPPSRAPSVQELASKAPEPAKPSDETESTSEQQPESKSDAGSDDEGEETGLDETSEGSGEEESTEGEESTADDDSQ
eukprot:gnl/Hemi2/22361_TR7446_c0_g1_i1.p1 gnl/Hemi2/22361_TR7446_c0_g1~~gnl/Hemi2/22361_TR7446_c0_g1_i1.p1  ORF type:complete len:235 (-),score=72.63 gnl/Hemi2/22361_TR7446_c0_g1_i1:131-835(-)